MLTNVTNAFNNTVSDTFNQFTNNSTPWYQSLGNFASSLSPIMSFINPLLGGATSLLGGLFGQSSQQEQNEFELQLNRENNEHNYRIWQEQKAHDVNMFNMENQANIDMWNMNNAYNDPSAQVERLRNAGLNPSLMMGGNPTGVASSAPASAHANSSQAPTMQAPNQMPSPGVVAGQQALQFLVGTAQSLNTLSQANSINRNIGIDVDTKYQNYQSGELAYQNDKLNYRRNQLAFMKQEDEYEDWQQMRDDIILTAKATRLLAELNVAKQEKLNEYLDAQQQLSLAKLAEEVSFVIAQTNMTKAQEKKLIADRFYVWKMANLVHSQTKLNNQLYQFNEDTELFRYTQEQQRAYQSFDETNIKANEATLKSYGVKEVELVFDSMVNSLISHNSYESLLNEFNKGLLDLNDNWYYKGTKAVGDGLRNLLGGIISGSASYKF